MLLQFRLPSLTQYQHQLIHNPRLGNQNLLHQLISIEPTSNMTNSFVAIARYSSPLMPFTKGAKSVVRLPSSKRSQSNSTSLPYSLSPQLPVLVSSDITNCGSKNTALCFCIARKRCSFWIYRRTYPGTLKGWFGPLILLNILEESDGTECNRARMGRNASFTSFFLTRKSILKQLQLWLSTRCIKTNNQGQQSSKRRREKEQLNIFLNRWLYL